MKRRFVLYLLLSVVLLSAGLLFYYSYDAYSKKGKFQRGHVNVIALEKLGALRLSAGEELFEGARYYGVKGVNYADRLSAIRHEVDRASQALLRWVEEHNPEVFNRAAIEHFVNHTKAMRLHVDALDPSYQTHFNGADGEDPISMLFQEMHLASEAYDDVSAHERMVVYARMIYTMKRLTDERALLSYFVARRGVITPKNMLAFEAVLEGKNARIATLNPPTSSKVHMPETPGNMVALYKKIQGMRIDIFEQAERANFTTSLYDIESIFREAISSVYRTEKGFFKKINQMLELKIDRKNTLFVRYLFLAVLLLLIGLYFLRTLRAQLREKLAIEESLSEIASDLDEERREELRGIMERGDRVAIYRFLAKTTMDARSAEERALRAEKAKDIFLANMSHEIRTPLNGILGFTQLMQSTPLNPEQEEFMGVIDGSSENLLKIVNDILDLSKIHAGKIELESIPFSITQNIEQAVEPHAARALEQDIEYSAFIDPSLPMVMGDPTKLTQVMTNLIGNAVKFTNGGGTVDIDVRKIKENDENVTIRFSIKDSGVGISPDKKKRIFEPFSQADVSTTREFGGTGLGLTITRDIVVHMGSVLELVSEVGRGSEFFFEMSFRRAGEDEDIHAKLEGLHFAYYHAGQSTLRQMERNLALYIRASGARFRMVSDHELDLLDDVDIFLLDYSNKETREKFDSLIQLGKKTIVISTAVQKHASDDFFNRVDRIIYRPLTASKLIRAYESMDVAYTQKHEQKRADDNAVLEGLKILVAEDNPINQKLIARVLEGMGIIPTLADNGKEALEIRLAQEFSAILMDIQMPVMGGVESTKEILKYEYSHSREHVPIIALTANALQGDRERYISEGFDDYISKPLNIDQLRQVLRAHCQRPSDESTAMDDTDDTIENAVAGHTILMYSRSNGLAQRLHRDALIYAGHAFETVHSESDLLDRLQSDPPEYVLLDAYTIDLKNCDLLSAIRRSRTRLFLFGTLNPLLGCEIEAAESYTSISVLLDALK